MIYSRFAMEKITIIFFNLSLRIRYVGTVKFKKIYEIPRLSNLYVSVLSLLN